MARASDVLTRFHPTVAEWFRASFDAPTRAQERAWPPILDGKSTLLLAPTGSGKTLAAFLAAIDRLMFAPRAAGRGCRVLYVSPLKALAVDVERNLRAPIAGITAAAQRRGEAHHVPDIAIRTGDTESRERARIRRHPPDILITTPESLYLMLTSGARDVLAGVETVIIDEIHAVAPTKRGTHLMLTLERLEALRKDAPPLQRIGLSATQRPLEEIARLLGGGNPSADGGWTPRAVEVVDAGHRRALEVRVEVPVEDMSRLSDDDTGPTSRSIWPAIHPRLVELVRAHRSTMIFVNSRRLSERLAGALNEAAGEPLVEAHHGSISKEKRAEIEDRLKKGDLPAMVATSSMELGVDMGAVDLVIQVEAPPSVASGMQRIGRAGHQVGAVSKGVVFPKFRGDLLACAAAVSRMQEGEVESTAYPRNPLDVLAQQVVAMVAMEPMHVDEVYDLVRRAAPYAELPRGGFEGVLDMLSGRYPSDELSELRPRVTWDRVSGRLTARAGAQHVAITNAGTIPDRGLYGVYLATDAGAKSRRVGELDEEMVFESRVGDVFLLGASSWRIEDITHDRVLVTPAPGQPGRMPFWHGDRPGRPLEFGRAIGALARKLVGMERAAAAEHLATAHGLDENARHNLLAYLHEQKDATGEVPSDRAVVVERYQDEVGDWRVCVMTPLGARVHAPWAAVVAGRLRAATDAHVEMLWSDDGMVFRLPDADRPPPVEWFLPDPDDVEGELVTGLGATSLFASHFRENAARALLLPRRDPRKRSPLWAQRKRAADLLAVASRFPSFPIILETYRQCLRDVFDLPGLLEVLAAIRSRKVRVTTVDSRTPSPFAASLMFTYVANFIYDQDAPLAERRAQALTVDHAQLRELLGDAELRELLDPDAVEGVGRGLQRLDGRLPLKAADHVHDLLRVLGDLTDDEIAARGAEPGQLQGWLGDLGEARRVLQVTVAGERRRIAVEDAGRYRDALGAVPPPGVPQVFLEAGADPLGDLVARYARTHGPFTVEQVARRLGLGVAPVLGVLRRLAERGKVLEGEFVPGGHGREWVDSDVLRAIKRRSLARLRREVEPVEPRVLARFLADWQGLTRPRAGLDALLGVVEQLQGAAIPASVLESEVLPARVEGYRPGDLDALCTAGEVAWRGLEPLGPHDGRIALYLVDQVALLAPPPLPVEGELAARIRTLLAERGALFFADITARTGVFPQDVLRTLWDLVWAGEVTNDTLAPLRSLLRASGQAAKHPRSRSATFRSRRSLPPGSEGRWSLLTVQGSHTETERRMALVRTLLERHGVLTREAVHAEGIPGGFSAVYDVLGAMEETGKVRRGYFVAGLGATQFALPGADERLRAHREVPDDKRTHVLAATDPANPYGAALPWPEREGTRPARAAGAQVVIHDGALAAFARSTEKNVLTFFPEEEPARGEMAAAVARVLSARVDEGRARALLVGQVDGADPRDSALGRELAERGFQPGMRGLMKRASPSGRLPPR
ncbi:MAG: DEAD/DEAH box helicase [Deltaproteobacteria bacterium]|nr:DEAD/DEAH box helicase [Deltaproteobacteria bacterium]